MRVRGPIYFVYKKVILWLKFGARMLGFKARIRLCWKSKFFYFSCFPCCLSLLVNSKHHENDTKNNVMTAVIGKVDHQSLFRLRKETNLTFTFTLCFCHLYLCHQNNLYTVSLKIWAKHISDYII